MADTKITALTALTAADPANDVIPIVDVSDTTMAASGTTKKISVNNILSSSPTASGALTVTGLVTAGSAAITGAATVGTTLGVTGASTLASVGVTGAATVGTTLLVGTNATLTNGNLIIGTSGKGIDFSATSHPAGMTSELLNDYEEGTWTPVLTFATPGTLVTTYNAQTGTFTKVGRLVTVMFRLSFAAAGIIKGTASGGLSITGLPYTVGSSLSYQYVDLGSNIADISSGSLALMVASGTAFSFETVSTSGTRIQRDSAALTAANFAASNGSFVTISGTFTYTV